MLDRFGNTIVEGDEIVVVGTMRAELGTLVAVVLGGGQSVRVTGADTILASAISETSHTHDPTDIAFVAADRIAASTGPGGATEEWPFYEVGQNLAASTSTAMARAALELGTAAVVDTGTGATNVPTTAQADARYDAIGAAAGVQNNLDTHEGAVDPHPQYATDDDLLGYAALSHQHTVGDLSAITTDRLVGRDSAGTGVGEQLTVSGGVEFTGSGGIQRSALTGDVTATAGSNATTIANDAVTNAKAANMAANTVKANATAGTADPADLAVGTNTVVGRVAGNIVAAQLATGQIADDAVTYAKMQPVSATDRVLGRSTAGAGDVEEIACTASGRSVISSVIAAKGDTLGGTAANTVGVLTVGANGTVLIADSAQTTGRKWGTRPVQVALMHWGGGVTWTNMPAAANIFVNYVGHINWFDATNYTEVRFVVNYLTAGSAGSKLILRYATSFPAGGGSAANYSDIGTSEVSCSISAAGPTLVKSSWIALASGAKADLVLCVVGSGGDGIVDPQFYDISAEFR